MSDQYFTLPELTELFGFKNQRATKAAIKQKRFPVPTYKISNRHVADVAVVNKFFEEKRQEGLHQLETCQ